MIVDITKPHITLSELNLISLPIFKGQLMDLSYVLVVNCMSSFYFVDLFHFQRQIVKG